MGLVYQRCEHVQYHAVLVYELREEIFKFSEEGGECGDLVICVLWTICDYIRIGVQLLGLSWWALEGGSLRGLHRALCDSYGCGVSVWIPSADNIMIAFASFVVGRVVAATKGAFFWGVSAFRAIRTIVLATAFDARIRSIAVASPVLLAACALRDVVFVCSRWFYV
jgi:hypothetical protein